MRKKEREYLGAKGGAPFHDLQPRHSQCNMSLESKELLGERERERDRDRDKDRERGRERERVRQRETERERDREVESERGRQRVLHCKQFPLTATLCGGGDTGSWRSVKQIQRPPGER